MILISYFQAQYRRILSCRCTADTPQVITNRGGIANHPRGGGGLLQNSNPLGAGSRIRTLDNENGISLRQIRTPNHSNNPMMLNSFNNGKETAVKEECQPFIR